MVTIKTPKNAEKYNCEMCRFKCSKLCDYNRHLSTAKHKKITNDNKMITNEIKIENNLFQCICGKEYHYSSGLSRHKKTCNFTPLTPEENIQTTIEHVEPNTADLMVLVKELMTQNAELQNTMREMIPHIGNNNNNNTNSHNTFNIQMFLENECKNAISIQDFIKSIEINMSHLVAISKDGYVDSISNVLIQALNQLAVTDRPLHCTDLKREIIYIKNNTQWNKSTADATPMNEVITSIEDKHYAQVKKYVREHPQSQILDTPEYNFYNKACMNSLGNCEDHDKLNKKICKKVLPQVKLDKSVAS